MKVKHRITKNHQMTAIKHLIVLVVLAGGFMETRLLAGLTPSIAQMNLDCPLQTFSDRDGNGSFETTRMACVWVPVH